MTKAKKTKFTLPSGGGSFVRAKDGTLMLNPDSQSTPKDAPASDAKTNGVKPPKKEA